MSSDIVDRVIKRVNALPPLPAAVQQLCKMTEDTESSYDQMAEVIASDEVLTTKILHLANSSFYGLSQRVPTISQAVIVIGFHGIRSLAVGVTVFGFKAGETMQEKTPLAGGVVDETLPSETRAIFERRGVLLLDFSQWRQENARTKGTALWDITRLRNWLNERLQRSASTG